MAKSHLGRLRDVSKELPGILKSANELPLELCGKTIVLCFVAAGELSRPGNVSLDYWRKHQPKFTVSDKKKSFHLFVDPHSCPQHEALIKLLREHGRFTELHGQKFNPTGFFAALMPDASYGNIVIDLNKMLPHQPWSMERGLAESTELNSNV